MLTLKQKNIVNLPNKPDSEYTGLCLTCNHAPQCSYLDNPFDKVLQCEEFDCQNPVADKCAKKDAEEHLATPVVIHDSMSGKGLCADCQNRTSCNFPKAEGGVWQCEHYC